MDRFRLILVTMVSLAMFCLPTAAQAPQPAPQAWTQVGSLMCKVDPNVGFIFAGHQPMQCTYTQGALSGEYVGVSADVGFVLGGGANVLMGGSGRTVELQPSLAFNVVLGVSSLKLRPATWR